MSIKGSPSMDSANVCRQSVKKNLVSDLFCQGPVCLICKCVKGRNNVKTTFRKPDFVENQYVNIYKRNKYSLNFASRRIKTFR